MSNQLIFQPRDHREPGHFWADNEILDDYFTFIGPYAFAVYMLLGRWANNGTGQCDRSIEEMARKLNFSVNTVKKALKTLVDATLITITPRSKQTLNGKAVHYTSIYTLLTIKGRSVGDNKITDKVGHTVTQVGGSFLDPGVGHHLTQGGSSRDPGVGHGVTHMINTKEKDLKKTKRENAELALDTSAGKSSQAQIASVSSESQVSPLEEPNNNPKSQASANRDSPKSTEAKPQSSLHQRLMRHRHERIGPSPNPKGEGAAVKWLAQQVEKEIYSEQDCYDCMEYQLTAPEEIKWRSEVSWNTVIKAIGTWKQKQNTQVNSNGNDQPKTMSKVEANKARLREVLEKRQQQRGGQ